MGTPSQNKLKIILLAEDEPVIAMVAEDMLAEAGFTVAGPFAQCALARTWLDEHTPDAALLDVKLADDLCLEVARTLLRRGVPMVFFSGGEFPAVRAEFRHVPWFEKPVDYEGIVEALRELVDRQGGSRSRDLAGSSGAPSPQE